MPTQKQHSIVAEHWLPGEGLGLPQIATDYFGSSVATKVWSYPEP